VLDGRGLMHAPAAGLLSAELIVDGQLSSLNPDDVQPCSVPQANRRRRADWVLARRPYDFTTTTSVTGGRRPGRDGDAPNHTAVQQRVQQCGRKSVVQRGTRRVRTFEN